MMQWDFMGKFATHTEPTNFGSELFRFRTSRGQTQAEIAKLAQLNRGYYSLIRSELPLELRVRLPKVSQEFDPLFDDLGVEGSDGIGRKTGLTFWLGVTAKCGRLK